MLGQYDNGGYRVTLYPDGTKVRDTLDASRPPVLPEHMDLKITDWCDAGCAWCHEGSTRKGQHGDLDATLALLSVLPPGAEIAIGGGDPLSHPGFEAFVRGLRAQGLVPSVTVNGRHLARHRPMLDRLTGEGQLFGVGVSYHEALPDWDYEHMVVHLIAGIDPPSVLHAATRRHKVLVLGYKTFGRGAQLVTHAGGRSRVDATLAAWYRGLFWAAQRHHLSFDNLAIEQLKPLRLFADRAAYTAQHMGEEGLFSLYVDAVTQTCAISSYSVERQPWTTLEHMFAHTRAIAQGRAHAPPSQLMTRAIPMTTL